MTPSEEEGDIPETFYLSDTWNWDYSNSSKTLRIVTEHYSYVFDYIDEDCRTFKSKYGIGLWLNPDCLKKFPNDKSQLKWFNQTWEAQRKELVKKKKRDFKPFKIGATVRWKMDTERNVLMVDTNDHVYQFPAKNWTVEDGGHWLIETKVRHPIDSGGIRLHTKQLLERKTEWWERAWRLQAAE